MSWEIEGVLSLRSESKCWQNRCSAVGLSEGEMPIDFEKKITPWYNAFVNSIPRGIYIR